MTVEIETEAAQFPEKKYINGIFVAVHLPPPTSTEALEQRGPMYFVFCRLYPFPPATTPVFEPYLSPLYA